MKLLQVSYILFLLNCSEILHNKLFSCLVPADVIYSTSWRNIRGNDTFRCAKVWRALGRFPFRNLHSDTRYNDWGFRDFSQPV